MSYVVIGDEWFATADINESSPAVEVAALLGEGIGYAAFLFEAKQRWERLLHRIGNKTVSLVMTQICVEGAPVVKKTYTFKELIEKFLLPEDSYDIYTEEQLIRKVLEELHD